MTEAKLLFKYENGNSQVEIYDDGTRIIETEDDEFVFSLPCNADIKITNQCFMGCEMCHENSIPTGKHAPLENFEFLKSWGIGKECALGGGSITTYPYLNDLLNLIKECKLIANTTVHESELINNFDLIKSYQDQGLIKGVGISYSYESDEFIKCVKKLDNVVFHVIAGLVTYKDLKYLSKNFDKPKILILGYKLFRRGNQLYDKIGGQIEKNIRELALNMPWVFNHFYVCSFDNLALSQLNIKDLLTEDEWSLFFQGEEGSSNIYIDAVEGQFACNSTATERYTLKTDMKEMFDVIKTTIQ